jgi:copper chaperone CopZ
MHAAPILVSALAIVGAAEAGAQEKARPAEATTVTLNVSGMSCSICAATVERTAKRLAGVTAVTASQPRGIAEVTYDASKTTAEDIAKFIEKHSGFRAEVPKAKR